jgi:glycosyltransferase involved in cell wall biosynthesis
LTRPSPHGAGVPAWLGELWSERADLRVAFPRIDSVDAERFLDWVRKQGVRETVIPPQLVPPATSPAVKAPAGGAAMTPGVNVYGYAFAESGTGQIVRSVVAALAAEGIPYAVVPFTRTISRQQHVFHDVAAGKPSFDTNLICVNADQVPLFFESMRGQLHPDARNIGLWAWEVEDFPAAMAGSEDYFGEVWGISHFTAAALSRRLTRPVRAFPLPVVVPNVQRRSRAELGMPDGFLFLFCFDYDSVFRRKNPLGVVAAFLQAFRDHPGVVLYLKTTNADRHVVEHEELRAAVAGRSNIVIRDAYVTSDDYFSMLDACDCYVSLHRAEGFGLTVAEAMALGKPVISTAYSSTVEFTNESNSFPVPAHLVEVGGDSPPYPPQARWAEPDVVAAAAQMTRVYADRDAATAVGARARADIETLHSPAARGALLRRLLEESRHLPSGPVVPSFFEAEATAVDALLGSPRADLPTPMRWLVNPFRRLVLRCMRVYWVQQLAIDRAILAALRTLRRDSHAELTSHDARHRDQQSETTRLRTELTALSAEVHALRASMPPRETK